MQFLHKPSCTVFNIGNLNQATLCPNCVQHRVNDKSPNCVQHRVNDKNLLQTMITKNIAV